MNKKTQWFFISLLAVLVLSTFVHALPAGPIITYVSNSTATPHSENRSEDAKGTITVVTMNLVQQDYKWKAYVGNVTGRLALDDANAQTIYDWELSTITGEVYTSRASSISWDDIVCVNDTVIANEETALNITASADDSISNTFNTAIHTTFLVGTDSIANSTCYSIATYVNDTNQTIDESAKFQEVLLMDSVSGSLVYSTLLETDALSYDGESTYDFQLLIAEDETSDVPTTYYFYVELG